jgi:GNAT superfamily N-acetyltransferase
MNIRKAKLADIDGIEKIYDRVHDDEEKGLCTIGWIRNVYPTRSSALSALNRNDLFVVEEDDKVVAAAVVNKTQVDVYKNVNWKHEAKDSEVMVLHCLVSDPNESGKGYGLSLIKFYENFAKENNCLELRIDTNARNLRARSLYKKLGYEEIGIVKCVFNGIPDVQLVCLEKYLG